MDIGPEVADWSYDERGNRERVAALRKAGVVGVLSGCSSGPRWQQTESSLEQF